MQDDLYLTTDEAAAYLRLKERKLYELVAEGAIPCSKVTGKWLFPRAALDRWVAVGLARPAGFVAEAVKVPATRDTLRAVGQEPFSLTPPEYAAYLERARANWAPIVKASGFSLDE